MSIAAQIAENLWNQQSAYFKRRFDIGLNQMVPCKFLEYPDAQATIRYIEIIINEYEKLHVCYRDN